VLDNSAANFPLNEILVESSKGGEEAARRDFLEERKPAGIPKPERLRECSLLSDSRISSIRDDREEA